jgi:hypothetical protein
MKLKRAYLHLNELQQSMKAFVQSNPYKSWVDPMKPEPPYVESFIVRVKEEKRPPREEWGAVIGDVVHNLRSSLDHLIWELTKDFQGGVPPSPLPKKKWREIEFPVQRVENRGKFDQALWGIDPRLKASIEDLQPHKAAEPESEPLWILHDLWNIDKHRHVHLVVMKSLLTDIDYIAGGVNLLEMTKGDEAELGDNAEMFRIHREKVPPDLPGMQMELRGEVKVRFGPESPCDGLVVTETLNRIYEVVTAILVEFESELA